MAAAVALLPAAPALAAEVAVLQALDKILGRISTLEAKVGQETTFGTLHIVVRACRTRPPEEPPESTAFLEVDDQRPGEERRRVFTGWMFASSPAISALEHPVYDVWVKSCRTE
ncbi:uncharacterized protein DUF2155 [Stella humosa]|uniref:Uncharacterized protein DUF2155 n=1 Tax=Stella humosa TaxID=94 RepID=A0A3N1MAD1_9PROT|nr:DUF2155 domain-containing protein [Stella humosa]ROQ00015.1 uncharacterized protein DUF2155 [Stella humosa]BBK30753.1 hypothetical protein STHU_13870 [Stella humosa]